MVKNNKKKVLKIQTLSELFFHYEIKVPNNSRDWRGYIWTKKWQFYDFMGKFQESFIFTWKKQLRQSVIFFQIVRFELWENFFYALSIALVPQFVSVTFRDSNICQR